MKVFFSGSIRGGRHMLGVYRHICDFLTDTGSDVLSWHVVDDKLEETESRMSEQQIYGRDMDLLKKSDCLVAEVTVPSMGVGYEICRALGLELPVLCVHTREANVSAMILGNPDIRVEEYADMEHLENILSEFVRSLYS